MDNSDISGRFGQCRVCDKELAKYKCPRCQLCTCSLACVNSHKAENNCTGVRNKVELVQKSDMDNFTLLSDYRFLEEIDHRLEDGIRNPHRRAICKGKESFTELPFHLRKLKLAARKRGTVIEFMPKHFSTHRENSTRYILSDNTIRWHVKLVFPQADLTFVEEKVDENCRIVDLLRKYMEPPSRLEEDESPSISAENAEKLSYYHSASYRRIAVLLQSSLCYRDKRYTEMFLSKSLKINLANRKIVEYPVFYVVLRDHLDFYLEGGESDDEELMALLNGSDKMNSSSIPISEEESLLQKKSGAKNIPRVTRRDGGLSFFDAFSDTDESE